MSNILPPRNNQLCESFREQFPGSSLHAVMTEFSLPTSLSDKTKPIDSPHQQVGAVGTVMNQRHHISKYFTVFIL